MKKILVILLALIVLLTGVFLIACDVETPDNNNGTSNTEQSGNENQGGSGGGGTDVPNTYTITFKADGDVVEIKTFSLPTATITEPDIPAKQCYTASWENYTLGTEDITVNAVYTLSHTALTEVEVVEPRCNAKGNIEYWSCTGCDKYFSDAHGTTEISKSSVVLDEVTCVPVNCECKWCGTEIHKHPLTHHARVEAQCNQTGNIEYWSCSLCDKYFSSSAGTVEIEPKLNLVPCSYVDNKCIWCKKPVPISYLSYQDKLTKLGITENSKQTWNIGQLSTLSLYGNGTIANATSAYIKSNGSNEYSHIYASDTVYGQMLLLEGGAKTCETYIDVVPGPVNTMTFFKNQSFVFEFDYMRGEAGPNGQYVNMSVDIGWRGGPITNSGWGMLNFTVGGGLRLSEYGTTGRGSYGNTKEFVTEKGVLYNIAVYVDLSANTLSLYVDGEKWDECQFLASKDDAATFGVTHIRFWCNGIPSGSQTYIDNYIHYASENGPFNNNYKTSHYGFKNDSVLLKIKHPAAWILIEANEGFDIICDGKTVGYLLGAAANDTNAWTVLNTDSYTANGVVVTKYTEQRNGDTETRYRYVYSYQVEGYTRTVTLTVACDEIDDVSEATLYTNVTTVGKTESDTVGVLSYVLNNPSSILILGNSFVGTSNIGNILTEMLENNGKYCHVTAVSRGYATVATYINDAAMMQSIRDGVYDAVFICGFYDMNQVANLGVLKAACDESGTTLVIFPAHNESSSAVVAAQSQYPSLFCLDWKSELDGLIGRGVDRWDLCIDDAHDHSRPLAGYVGAHMIYRAIYGELPTEPMQSSINQSYIDSILGNYAYVGDARIVDEDAITYLN